MRFVVFLLTVALSPLSAPAQITIETVLTDLERPVRLLAPPGDDRLFVVERGGTVRIFDQDGTPRGTFLDVSDLVSTNAGERGLLGMAFSPDYETTGRFYINYTDVDGDTRVVRYRRCNTDDLADPATAEILLSVTQPASNHNAGHLAFGPDGMLYIALGDGGGAGDLDNLAQDPRTLLGKMLRLDVSCAGGYRIPADNPFVGGDYLDEVWAVGLRNPWCFDFDNATGDLWIADVGQNSWEEINVQPAGSAGGENYGWRLMEGTHCFNPSSRCNDGSLVLPVHEYDHGTGCSISGGYVYRGAALRDFAGHYFFADYCTDRVWSMTWTEAGGVGSVTEWTATIEPTGGFASISAFGEDGHGELYILEYNRGNAHRIVAAPDIGPGGGAAGGARIDDRLQLDQNTPNPFNPRTEIAYALAADGPVTLRVFDTAGRLVRTLVDASHLPAGGHDAAWDGTDGTGRRVAAGVYFYRLDTAAGRVTRRMALVK